MILRLGHGRVTNETERPDRDGCDLNHTSVSRDACGPSVLVPPWIFAPRPPCGPWHHGRLGGRTRPSVGTGQRSDERSTALSGRRDALVTTGPADPAKKRKSADPHSPGALSRNMMTTMVGNLFPPLAALFSGPILGHALGVDGRGAVAAATAPLALITVVATFGIPEATTYFIARSPALLKKIGGRGFAIMTSTGLVSTAMVLLGREWLSGGNPYIAQLIVIASLAIVPNLLVGVLRGMASGLHRWRLVANERILSSVLRLVSLVPFWLSGNLTPLTATILLAVMPLFGALAYIPMTKAQSLAHQPGVGTDSESTGYRAMTSYGLRMWVGSISGRLLARLDQTLMTPLSSSSQLGLYVVAVSIGELPLIINSAVRDVTFAADARKSVDERLGASARISGVACATAGIVIGATMTWWVPVMFGAGFAAAVPSAAVILLSVVISTPGSIAGAGLSARGHPGLRSVALVIACVVNVFLLFVLVPAGGSMGAALATLAGQVVYSNLNLIFLWRRFGVSPRLFFGFRRADVVIIGRFARRTLGRQVD